MILEEHLSLGCLGTNCYILRDSESGECAVVDPAAKSQALISLAQTENIKFILLTHGHFDHIGFVNELKGLSNARVAIGKKDEKLLSDPALNLNSAFGMTARDFESFGMDISPIRADILLSDGDSLALGNTRIRFIETPGHTAGSGCYEIGEYLVTGDTLFKLEIGRTDFPTGSYDDILRSILKLKALGGDYFVLPGHEAQTALAFEIKNNPYFKQAEALSSENKI